MTSTTTRSLTRQEAEDLLFQEAELLDEGRFEEWLELFTEDATYWIPENEHDIDPRRETSMLYDDRFRMEDRVWRLVHGPAHAQIPPSRTRRLIGNVRVESSEGDTVTVYSNFAIYESRRNQLRTLAGRYEHHITWSGGRWRISLKKASLVDNDAPVYNLTFMV